MQDGMVWLTRDPKPAKTPAQTPAKAAVKVAKEVKQVARTEGTRPAKEVKSELVQRLETAIEQAPEQSADNITIEIPGDGTFTVQNTKEALTNLLARARKISTNRGDQAKTQKVGGVGDVDQQAQAVIKAYGSADAAYVSARRQRQALAEQETPRTAEERKDWNDQMEAADALIERIFDETSAGSAEVKLTRTQGTLARYQDGAEGFQQDIAKLQSKKRLTPLQKERLADLQERYSENQKRIAEFKASSAKFAREAAAAKVSLESAIVSQAQPSASQRLSGEGPGRRGSAVGMPPVPPGVAAGMHHSVLPVAMERIMPGNVDVPTVMQSIERAAAAVGSHAPIRTGRFGGNYLGIFKTWADVIRVRQANDIPTAAHELAHAVANQVFGSPKSNPMLGKDAKGRPLVDPAKSVVRDKAAIAELRAKGKALYGTTRPAAGYTAEGFAEFVREWLTTENVKARMPATAKWFEGTLLANEPGWGKALTESRQLIDIWRGQGALERAKEQMKQPDGRLKRLWTEFRKLTSTRAQVEEFTPLEELSRGYRELTGQRLRPSQDPYMLASAKRGTAGQVLENFVERGVQDVWGNTVGPSLKESLFGRVKPQESDQFAAYLWARRAEERWARGQNPGMELADAKYLRQKLETPDFIAAAQGWYKWWEGVLEYVKQASPEMNGAMIDAIRAGSRDYVPLAREMPASVKRAAQERLGGGLYRMHGSGLPIKDIYLQSLLVAENLIKKAHRDMVLESVFGLSKVEGMGWLVERVPQDRVRESVNIEKIRKQLEDMGVDTTAVPEDALLNFYRFADTPKGSDPILVRRTAGGSEWYQVPAQLFETLQGMETVRLGMVGDLLLGMPARAFKLGVTGLNASFSLFTNPARDFPTYLLQSLAGNPAARVAQYFGGLKDIVAAGLTGKESPAWQQFKQLGIQAGTFLGGDIAQSKRESRSLFRGRVFRRVASPVETLREALSVTEAAPRLAEMRMVGRELGWQPGLPVTPDQAVAMSVAAKRVTTDFSAGGTIGKQINQAVPFYNAAIQGMRAFARAFRTEQGWKEKPQAVAKATLTGLTLLTLPTLFNWWRNKDEDWYLNLPWRERYLYSNVEAEDGTIVQVPRPQDWGSIFMVLPEMLMDSWYRRDPAGATEGLRHIFDVANPADYPVLAKALLEQKANRIEFFDRPIVPRSELDLPPGDQRAYFSSVLAKSLGNAFPNTISPRRVDAAVRSVFGGVGGDVMDIPGQLLAGLGLAERREFEPADVPVFGRAFRRGGDFTGNSRHLAEFWDAYLTSRAERNGATRRAQQGQPANFTPEAMERNKILQAYHGAIKLQMEMAHRAESAEARRQLYRTASQDAERALKMIEPLRNK
jgi:hypothetical protein